MIRSPRLPVLLVVIAAAVSVLTSGCGSSAEAPSPTAYRAHLPAKGQEELAQSDRIRALDPCGYLDETAVNALGHVISTAIPGETTEAGCDIAYDMTSTPKGIYLLSLSTPISTEVQGAAIQIGQRTGNISSHSSSQRADANSCEITFPHNTGGYIQYKLLSDGDAAGSEDVCPELLTIATASERLLDTDPPRQNSEYLPKATKAWRMDPCLAMNTVYEPSRKYDVTVKDPFECYFWFDSTPNLPDNVTSVTYAYERVDTMASEIKSSDHVTIDGVDGVRSRLGDGGCSIDLFLGAGNPFAGASQTGKPENWIEKVDLYGENATTCGNLPAIASAVIKQYAAA